MTIVVSVLSVLSLSGCSGDNETTARVMAQQYIKSKLTSPDSAQWGAYDNMKAVSLGNQEWEVTGVVRAKNAFGVDMDVHYDLKEKAGDDDGNGWTLEGISMY